MSFNILLRLLYIYRDMTGKDPQHNPVFYNFQE